MNTDNGSGNQPPHPTQRPHTTSDLSTHDLYFVCLNVASLVVAAENANLTPAITRRFQRVLEELIEEYDNALNERNDLEARFEA